RRVPPAARLPRPRAPGARPRQAARHGSGARGASVRPGGRQSGQPPAPQDRGRQPQPPFHPDRPRGRLSLRRRGAPRRAGTRLIMRMWPRSLLGQMLLAVAVVLLLAQAISAALLWQAAEARREASVLNAAAFAFIVRGEPHSEGGERWRVPGPYRHLIDRFTRPLRIEHVESFAPLPDDEIDARRAEALRAVV